MNSLIIYYSRYGNTKKLAETVTGVLGSSGSARVVGVDQIEPAHLDEANLVVVGTPTHYQNLPEAVRSALTGLQRGLLAGKSVAAFDTSRKTWAPLMLFTAAHRLLPRLRKLRGKPIAPPETFLVDKDNLLCDGEIDRATAWADAILKQVKRHGVARTPARVS